MEDPVHDLIPKTSKAITQFDLAQRKEWAKARAAALEKWEKSRAGSWRENALDMLEATQRKAREVVASAVDELQLEKRIVEIENSIGAPEMRP